MFTFSFSVKSSNDAIIILLNNSVFCKEWYFNYDFMLNVFDED